MTYAPTSLRELAAYWTDKGGIDLGIVGDAAHATRPSYHNGLDRAIKRYGTSDLAVIARYDYSFRLSRDKAGASDAAMGFDIGKLQGTYTALQHFSRWLVAQCRANTPGARDVREVIYSPDGSRVQRWSGVDNAIHTGEGNGDSSHRYHTHISYYRDSENRDKLALFAPYFEGDEMPAIDWYPIARPAGEVTLKEGRGLVNLVTGKAVSPDDRTKNVLGGVHLAEPWSTEAGMQDGYLVRHAQQAHVALDGVSTFTPAPGEPGAAPSVLTGDDGSTYRRE